MKNSLLTLVLALLSSSLAMAGEPIPPTPQPPSVRYTWQRLVPDLAQQRFLMAGQTHIGGVGGAGSVTVVGAGNLTSTAIVTGGGSQTLQTPSATSTLDSSGNMVLAGNLTVNGTTSFAGNTFFIGTNGQTSGSAGLLNIYGNTVPTSGGQIHAGNNVLGTGAYWRGDPSTNGKFCFDTASQATCGAGSAWAIDFTAVASNVTTVVPNANTALPQAFNTSGQIPVSFSVSTGAFTGSATPSLGTDGSVAGSLQLANSAAAFHTIFLSAATANNTVSFFASAPATGDLIDCVTASTTCTLTDAGFTAANVVRKDTTNTGAAAMTLDMSASTTANAFKVPIGAGLTASADGAIAYDTTNKNTHIRTNGADGLAVSETGAIAAGFIPKSGSGTFSNITASSIADSGVAITGTEVATFANTQVLTANSSGITATTPGTIIFTLSAMKANTNYAFHCAGTYSQASAAAANGVSVQGATNAPTRLDASYNAFTSNAGVAAEGNIVNLASTTQTALSGTFTPSATGTNFNWYVDGVVQNGASATTLKVGFFTGNASDALTINAGSYCSINP